MTLKMPLQQIATFVDNGGTIITVDENKKEITVYGDRHLTHQP
jgi:hypothetical protein